jgi:thiol-disulfide isomerase/thioredoxin
MTSETLRGSSRPPSCVRRAAVAGLLAAGLCLAAVAWAAPPAQPELTLKTLGGDPFDLAGQRGHVVLVNFWATWCVPCRQEMPALNEFYGGYRARGVEVIGVSVDRGRDLAQVRDVMRGFSFPAGMLRDASRNDFGSQNALPVTFVIDTEGRVRGELRPDTTPLTRENLARVIDPLLPAK